MDTRRARRIGVGLAAILAVVSVARAQLPDGTAHWKSTIEVEGGPAAGAGPIQAEIWVKAGKLRMQTRVLGMTQNFVKTGETVYQWTDGQKAGMKMSASIGGRSAASGDYATRIDEYRAKGKKTGSDAIDGHPCDIYELTTAEGAAGSRKETVWLATDLRNFPLKVIAESNGTRVTSHNSEVVFRADAPDTLFAAPTDIEFQDMSEMMKKMQAR